MEKINNNLWQIPQVIILTKGVRFKPIISFLVKKIICLDSNNCLQSICINCQKFQNNNYFDLKWLKLNDSNYLKKQDIINLINDLSMTSIENNNFKIYVIEQIEYSTLEASNAFLKFLENINPNTYLIFTTNNLNKVLTTIKSRSQILNLSLEDINFNENPIIENNEAKKLLIEIVNIFRFNLDDFNLDNFKLILTLVNQFIINDNNNWFDSNFLLIKELSYLKQKSILFFKILFLLAQSKVFNGLSINEINNSIINKLLKDWNNNNQKFLIKILETTILLENQFSNKINLNLLLNKFFITIYQGYI